MIPLLQLPQSGFLISHSGSRIPDYYEKKGGVVDKTNKS